MTTRILMNFEGGLVEEAEARTVTATNAVASTEQAKFGTQSLKVTSSASTSGAAISGTVDMTGDSTAELWFYVTSHVASRRTLLGFNASPFDILALNSSNFLFTELGTVTNAGATPVIAGEWNHAAISYVGGVNRFFLFLNGVLQASSSVSGGAAALRIGNNTGSNLLNVYIDGLRFVQGKALYTQNFTPPTAPPTIEYPPFNSHVNDHIVGQQATIMPLALTTPLGQAAVWFTYGPTDGTLTLSGTVKEQGTPNAPLWRRVNLIEQVTGRVIREVWSDATTGEYSFPNILGGRKYTVVSYDHTGYHRAVIADNLEPI